MEKYLPEIKGNTWVKKKEIDLSTLYEDPLFDPSRRPGRNFGRGKMSVDARMGGGVVQFGAPLMPFKTPSSAIA